MTNKDVPVKTQSPFFAELLKSLESEQLAEAQAKQSRDGDKKIHKAGKAAIDAGAKADAEEDDDTSSESDQLVKSLQHAHACGAITGPQACHLDLLRRQGKLPENVRTALLALDLGEGA
jgi:hypothetical protein